METTLRKIIDCRDIPTEKNCTLIITGTEEEVLDAAMRHVVTVHGYRPTAQLRERLRTLLKDEVEAKLVNL